MGCDPRSRERSGKVSRVKIEPDGKALIIYLTPVPPIGKSAHKVVVLIQLFKAINLAAVINSVAGKPSNPQTEKF